MWSEPEPCEHHRRWHRGAAVPSIRGSGLGTVRCLECRGHYKATRAPALHSWSVLPDLAMAFQLLSQSPGPTNKGGVVKAWS